MRHFFAHFIFSCALIAECVATPYTKDVGWEAWKLMFNKTYATPCIEKHHRKAYIENKKFIESHRSDSYKVHGNVQCDRYFREFKKTDLGYVADELISKSSNKSWRADVDYNWLHLTTTSKIPNSFDWRTVPNSYVPPIVTQGDCGGCWSFSATGCLATHYYNARRSVRLDGIPLSEQQLLDCVYNDRLPCDGGTMRKAFTYIKLNHGIAPSALYPYRGDNKRNCAKVDKLVANVQSYVRVPSDNYKMSIRELKAIVALIGPITTAFDVRNKAIMMYSSGVFDDCPANGIELNHAVVIVGYTPDYWIIRNSWGTSWGMSGYMHLKISTQKTCGVFEDPVYPIM